jgi:hypothetical protein
MQKLGNARRLQDGYETDCSTGTSRMHGTFVICHHVEGDIAAPGAAMPWAQSRLDHGAAGHLDEDRRAR